jgi:glucan phosphoethanolaminetransferase (alkaline phosphatase superfamily)
VVESIAGLPAHPLLVHAPIVLVPLAAIVAIVVALRPRLHPLARWLVVAAAAIALATTQLAVSSGYRLDEAAGGAIDTNKHEALGETSRNLVVLFLLSALATAVAGRALRNSAVDPAPAGTIRAGLTTAASATTVASAVAATIWLARTGHEGARLVWETVLVLSAG